MSLAFQNAYTERVYIALIWFDGGCQPHPWRKLGWFLAAPGDTVEVFAGDLQQLQNSNIGWFAQAGGADGPCWSGSAHHAYAVPHNASFDQCFDDLAGCNASYPFRGTELNKRWSGLTIMLLVPGTAGQSEEGFAWGIPTYLPEAVQFASGTLGPSSVTASATWSLNYQGFWNFNGNIHESGVLGQDYGFGMALDVEDADGNPIAVVHSGSVGPDLPLLNPNDSWNDQGFDQRIADLWPAIVDASCRSGLHVKTDPAQIIEGVLEILGIALGGVLVGAALLLGPGGKEWECPNAPHVNVEGDNKGGSAEIVWTCFPKGPK